MASKKRTWLWILLGLMAACIVFVIALAGFGLYFVQSHISTKQTSTADAHRAFDQARAPFKEQPAIYEIDERERPKQVRRFADMPTATSRPKHLYILGWDTEKERLVNVTIPFWILKLGKQKIDIAEGGFSFEHMELDVKELERVGPVLLLDYRARAGQRVLIWTQ